MTTKIASKLEIMKSLKDFMPIKTTNLCPTCTSSGNNMCISQYKSAKKLIRENDQLKKPTKQTSQLCPDCEPIGSCKSGTC